MLFKAQLTPPPLKRKTYRSSTLNNSLIATKNFIISNNLRSRSWDTSSKLKKMFSYFFFFRFSYRDLKFQKVMYKPIGEFVNENYNIMKKKNQIVFNFWRKYFETDTFHENFDKEVLKFLFLVWRMISLVFANILLMKIGEIDR